MDTADTNEAKTKSIIDPKYAEAYRNKPKDWLDNLLETQIKDAVMKDKIEKEPVLDKDGAAVLDEEGNPKVNEVTKQVQVGKPKLNLDKLFDLCQKNSIATAEMEAQRGNKNAPGRIRMTLGNSLRAAARHRHGLFNTDGEWVEADEAFIGEYPLTQNKDGSKIEVAKPVAEDTEESAEA